MKKLLALNTVCSVLVATDLTPCWTECAGGGAEGAGDGLGQAAGRGGLVSAAQEGEHPSYILINTFFDCSVWSSL